MDDLHGQLVTAQSTAELARKQQKASRRHIWTHEDIDLADRQADELHAAIQWDEP